MTPKDFFLHVATMVALYVSSISVIALLFQIVNVAFPDQLMSGYYVDPYSSGIRWAIASLAIIFPLYIFFSWMIAKDQKANPEKRNLGIRRWLTFITLFLTGIAIAIDLVVLLNSFLGGEITARFGLKVLAMLVVTGAVFGYYLWDLRGNDLTSKRPKNCAIAAGLFVLVSIIGGFIIMGSPMTQRKIRLDEQKTQNLQTIQWQIINVWQQKGSLPVALAELNDPISGFYVPVDPESAMAYEYRKTGTLAFELCADFNTESKKTDSMKSYGMDLGGLAGQENWQHGVGRVCFTRIIDPQLYPVVKR
jgi:hypothetical protein